MMNVLIEQILGSPFAWAPSVTSGPGSLIADDLQASHQHWNGRSAG